MDQRICTTPIQPTFNHQTHKPNCHNVRRFISSANRLIITDQLNALFVIIQLALFSCLLFLSLIPATRFEYTNRTKPALQTHHDPKSAVVAARTAAAHKSQTKNFISENALAVIMADARRPVRGDIDYLKKEDFGKTPAYLEKVKAEISAEKDYIRRVMEAEAEEESKYQPKTHVLPEEERLKLLHQLKVKWENINKQYQTTTHMITLGQNADDGRKSRTIVQGSSEAFQTPFISIADD